MAFRDFKREVDWNFQQMIKNQSRLYKVNVEKDAMWDAYLNSFPESERQSHNCNACRSFIKQYGNVVAIIDNKIVTYWKGIKSTGYEATGEALANLMLNAKVQDVFLAESEKLGLNSNKQRLEDGTIITWEHLYTVVPKTFVNLTHESIESRIGKYRDSKNVLKRSLAEISDDSVEVVLELIAQNSLYRGAEYVSMLKQFKDIKKLYAEIPDNEKDNFCWTSSEKYEFVSRIRNTAIGTLLVDISNGVELDRAVTAFERIMAPANYKRPNAVVTKRMVEQAQKKIEELGLMDSLPRRHAKIDDITVNNVLFVNRDVKKALNIFDQLASSKVNPKQFSKAEEMSIEDFIKNVLPNTTKLEVLFENSHIPNLVTLTAPVNKEAPTLFKWNNNFAWSYNGNVADSFKEKVKAAGGNTEGVLRCSLHWFNYDDLDIHVIEPNGNEICFRKKVSYTSGTLDVDMNAGAGASRDAVENIIWTDQNQMRAGKYKLQVNNYCKRETIDGGFECEIECNGILHKFSYNKNVADKDTITVAEFKWSPDKDVEIIKSIEGSSSTKSVKMWNIDTMQFQEVSIMMLSPNYWDEQAGIGNKHYFFMLKDCQNPDSVRGFFNEYLKPELNEHRRVFEALGSKMQTPFNEEQLSGLGFSSTSRNQLICKVTGSTVRTIKINF